MQRYSKTVKINVWKNWGWFARLRLKGLDDFWRGEEDTESAYQVDCTEGNETEPINNASRELPLPLYSLFDVVFAEPASDRSDLVQNR